MNVVQKRLNDLEYKLSQAEAAARINAETIAELQKDRDLYRDMGVSVGKELLRERETLEIQGKVIAEQLSDIERLNIGNARWLELHKADRGKIAEQQREIERLMRVKVAAEKYINGWLVDEASDRELCMSDEHFALVRELRVALEAL